MLVDYSYDTLCLLADVSVKAVLLCGLVGLGVWIFRTRDDNVRHRLWTSLLVGMLALPVLVGVTPRVPLPGWLYPEFSPQVAAESAGGEGFSSRESAFSDGPGAAMPGRDRPGELNPRIAPGLTETRSRSAQSDAVDNAANPSVPATAPRTAATAEPDGTPTPWWPVAAAIIYAVGFSVFLVRLLLGVGRVRAILRRARPVSLAQDGRSSHARIRETPEVRVPMVAGWFRPCILLPEDWSAWSKSMLTSVLGHEEAHIARRDHWVTLAAEINRCLYWFHPAAWVVRRELMRLAELSCDGAVVESTGDRAEYARHLLTVAGRLADSSNRLATCGISMARRINVETRIDAILDVRRPPAKRLGVLGTVLLLAVMVPAVCVFAGLGPAEGEGKTPEGAVSSGDEVAAKSADDTDGNATEVSKSTKETIRVSGRVLNGRGQPVIGAHVAVVAKRERPTQGGDLENVRDEVLAEATTDAEGRFLVMPHGLSSKSHREPTVIAGADGHGLAWQRLDPDAEGVSVDLTLPNEQIIRGKVVDQQGRPASGVEMRVHGVMITQEPEAYANGIGYCRSDAAPAAWPSPVVSDEEGRFAFRGIGAGYGVLLGIDGTDRFATQTMSLNTGSSEKRRENDDTYRPQVVRNLEAGEEFVLRLAPSQIIEGVIRFEDTEQPAPHARVTVYARQEGSGSMIGVAGRADAEGRFRINPHPGAYFYVRAYPPEDTPYLIRRKEIKWKPSDDKAQCDMALPRGVLVRGRIVEAKSRKPIAGASIQYKPESRNNSHVADDIVTGWQAIELSNDDGRFSVPVLPGPGRLLVNGPSSDYVPHVIGSRMLDEGLPGGRRNYVHAIKRIEPKPGDEPVEMTITLNAGVTVEGRLLDPDGKPAKRALMISRQEIPPSSTTWRAIPSEVWGGRFALPGCAPAEKYPVYFLDPDRRLGTAVHLDASDAGTRPEVRLAPCGAAKVRYVDGKGKPYANKPAPVFMMVMTPGPSYYYGDPDTDRSALCADTDFPGNMDHTNYWPGPRTDADGRVTFEALIPGATYRVVGSEKGRVVVKKDFTVKPGETVDLGEIVIDEEEGEVKSLAR